MTTEQMSHDIYTPLNEQRSETRLVVIQPSSDPDGIVECSLTTVSLNDSPSYFALSYVWGDATITEKALINGIPLMVTVNLAAALRQLRSSRVDETSNPVQDLPTFLWVDAICVNQRHVSERNSQVQLMREIYLNAIAVISWLGPEVGRSSEAMAAVQSIAQEVAVLGPDDNRLEWMKRYPYLLENDDSGPSIWDAMNDLWKMHYWTRAWVLQETVLARRILVMCGTKTILWEDIFAVSSWAASLGELSISQASFIPFVQWLSLGSNKLFRSARLKTIEHLRRIWQHNHSENSNIRGLFAVQVGWKAEATDPRDKVYGFLGLSQLDIIPDYRIPVRDLYIEAALKELQIDGLGGIMNMAGSADENKFGLPFWVPDWSTYHDEKLPFLDSPPYEHCTKNPIYETSKPGVLGVHGVQLGEILKVESDECSGNATDRALKRIWKFVQNLLSRLGEQPYCTGIPPLQAIFLLLVNNATFKFAMNDMTVIEIPSKELFRYAPVFVAVLCLGFEGTGLKPGNYKTYHEALQRVRLASDERFSKTFSQQFIGKTSQIGPWENAESALEPNLILQVKLGSAIEILLRHHVLFHTSSGYLGIAPSSVRPHDIVYAMKGCPYPVIPRREDSHFVLVGSSLVQGFMDGEIEERLKERAESLEKIEIY